jgi:hypothetical protein
MSHSEAKGKDPCGMPDIERAASDLNAGIGDAGLAQTPVLNPRMSAAASPADHKLPRRSHSQMSASPWRADHARTCQLRKRARTSKV